MSFNGTCAVQSAIGGQLSAPRDESLQRFIEPRLPARTTVAEVFQHYTVKPQSDLLFGRGLLWTALSRPASRRTTPERSDCLRIVRVVRINFGIENDRLIGTRLSAYPRPISATAF